jgi:hypothetical protein
MGIYSTKPRACAREWVGGGARARVRVRACGRGQARACACERAGVRALACVCVRESIHSHAIDRAILATSHAKPCHFGIDSF